MRDGVRRTVLGVVEVPARVGGERDQVSGCSQAAQLVAVGIHLGHENRERRPYLGRLLADDSVGGKMRAVVHAVRLVGHRGEVDSRQVWKIDASRFDQGAVGDQRKAVGRRRRAVDDPLLHPHQQGAHEP